jgi:hypothetical protein
MIVTASIKRINRFVFRITLFFCKDNKHKTNLEINIEEARKKNLLEFRLYLFASSKSPSQQEDIPRVNPHELHCTPLIICV